MKNAIILALAIAAVALLVGCGLNRQKNNSYKSLDNREFAKLIKSKDVCLIDVRTAEEFAEGHIPGALNIDMHLTDFVEKCLDVLQPGQTAALYCRSGRRSKVAAEALAKKWPAVRELNGGFINWDGEREE